MLPRLRRRESVADAFNINIHYSIFIVLARAREWHRTFDRNPESPRQIVRPTADVGGFLAPRRGLCQALMPSRGSRALGRRLLIIRSGQLYCHAETPPRAYPGRPAE